MKKTPWVSALSLIAIAPLHGQLLFDQNVTPAVIFGSGNANGSYTTNDNVQASNIEIGLRGKLRFNDLGQPENTFNSNGDGSYTFLNGASVGGASWATSTTPVWNFEWSVNTDVAATSTPSRTLNELRYNLYLDFDPSPVFSQVAATTLTFDPINVTAADHSLGTNSTTSGNGIEVNPADYITALTQNNVAQQSWSYEFFNNSSPFDAFDPNATGTYTIRLEAIDDQQGVLAFSEIDIHIVPVPEPSTIGLLAMAGMSAVLFIRRRIKARR